MTGFFARPLTLKEFYIVGFSMSAWGEFAFILATASFAEGTLDEESFSAVLLAVLLSVILSPYALSFTIKYFEKQAQKKMNEHLKQYEDTNLHPLYFAINSKARGQWGHQDKILHRLFNLQLEIIDFRSWHAPEYNHSHHRPLTKESFYVQDMTTALPPTQHLDSHEKKQLMERVKVIRDELRDALGNEAVIHIKRWLPGVTKTDDQLEPTDDYVKAMFGGEYKPKHRKTAEYCRREAFKQAHSIMSVFERKSTMEELARKSKQSLHSLYSMRSLSDLFGSDGPSHFVEKDAPCKCQMQRKPTKSVLEQFEKDMDEHSITFSESPIPQKAHKKTRSYDGASRPPLKLKETNSNPTSSWSMNRHRNKRQLMHHLTDTTHSGEGHSGRAGGAGALPITNSTINIDDHWNMNDDEEEESHRLCDKGNDMSYMSYIYGDEDSQHHKLPEYSMEPLPENAQFHPTLPGLAENDDDMDDMDDMDDINDGAETSDRETSNSKSDSKPTVDTNKTAISMDTNDTGGSSPMTGNSNVDIELISHGLNSEHSASGNESNKLRIKIYPPALQAVSSGSPISPDIESPESPESPDQYLD
jgi:hypothetical protein